MLPKTKLRIAVIIPTYNEAGNIGKLADRFCRQVFPGLGDYDMRIVVVDGNSTDGTAGIVEEKMKVYPAVRLIREKEKGGIGAAYMEGFAYAMNELGADIVVEFDGDMQHPPEILPTLLAKMAEGYDYVVGSRNIRGGSEPRGRGAFRLALTDFGGFIARLILFFPGKYFFKVSDPTSGLKATRVKGCLDRMDLRPEHLYSKKFGYKVQLLSETLSTGARYAEIPLRFENRLSGKSKFEKDTALDILKACLKTRLRWRMG